MTWWKAQGYNEEKGSTLANAARRKYNGLGANGRAQGNCVGIVRQVINDVNHTNYKRFGQARNIGHEYLCNDPNFKKIVVDMSQLKASDIPPGAIVLYPSGYAGGPLSYCGHGEIAGGNGFGYSDVKTTLLSNHGKRRNPCEIWIPV